MTHPIRSILALTILAIVLAACGTTIGAPASEVPAPSEPATPSVQPSVAPSVEPSVEPEPSATPAPLVYDVVGTITAAEMAFSGPGAPIAEVIVHGDSGEYPNLVNGVIFLDADGRIYLATALTDDEAPTFSGPMLEVLNMDNEGPSWDLAFAGDIGLREANGIRFREEAQVLGYIDVK